MYNDIDDLFDDLGIQDFGDVTLEVGYTNNEGDHNTFVITDIRMSSVYGNKYIEARCLDADGEPEGMTRTFRLDRFDSVILQ